MSFIEKTQRSSGLAAGIGAFCIWGMLVLYWQGLKGVPALEILAHRVLWSLLCIFPLLLFTKRLDEVKAALLNARTSLGLLCSSTLIATNWCIFIYMATNAMVLETSLGYFMNPLASMLVGMIFLRERLERLQIAAILLVAGGVAFSVAAYGSIPWLGISLAVTFALYSLVRKVIQVEATPGLFLETVIMAPFAMGYLIFLHQNGQDNFFSSEAGTQLMLIGTGLITSIPMLLFTYAARHMKLSTLGFTQYISPTITFFIGAYVLGEPITPANAVTFVCIWIALGIYSWCGWMTMKARR